MKEILSHMLNTGTENIAIRTSNREHVPYVTYAYGNVLYFSHNYTLCVEPITDHNGFQ